MQQQEMALSDASLAADVDHAGHDEAATTRGTADWRHETLGALSGLAVTLGSTLALGMMVFAPLGAGFAAHALLVAIGSSALGVLLVPRRHTGGPGICVPRSSVCLVAAGWVATLAQDRLLMASLVQSPGILLAMSALPLACCGLFQLAFAALRLGNVVRFVPYPVVAGVMNGVAILVIPAQLAPILGLPAGSTLLPLPPLAAIDPLSALAGCTALVVCTVVAMRRPAWPEAIFGLGAATVVFWLARAAFPAAPVGGVIAGRIADFGGLSSMWHSDAGVLAGAVARHGWQMLGSGLALAVVSSLDSLMATVTIDLETGADHRANRLLMGLGLANLACAGIAGVPIALSRSSTLAIHRAKGGSAAALGMAALLLVLPFTPLPGWLPVAALAALLMVSQAFLFDRWSRGLARASLTQHADGESWSNLAIVVGVAAVTVYAGVSAALLVGFCLSIAMLLHHMYRSVVRAVLTGAQCRSRCVYSPQAEQLLRERAGRITLIELDGALFFGNVETLARRVQERCRHADFLILDFRRVTHLDASAAISMIRLVRQARVQGTVMGLSGLAPGAPQMRALEAHAPQLFRQVAVFLDRDAALEWAEREVLGTGRPDAEQEIAIAEIPLLAGLPPDDVAYLQARLIRTEAAAGETLFRAGEAGDRLYLLARGAVTIAVPGVRGAPPRRIVTFAAGACFGELAMLAGKPRTASAHAERPSVCYELTAATLKDAGIARPALAQALLHRLALNLGERLRDLTDVWRADEQDGPLADAAD